MSIKKFIQKNRIFLLLLILILGSFLRIYGIGKENFWIDEAATVYTTKQTQSELVSDIYKTTRHAPQYFEYGGTPPFYFLLANYWTNIFGLSEAKLRALSALFGIISIYIIFLIGKMMFGSKLGLISAFILSINYMHIEYSQEARAYSLLVFLTLLSVYFLLSALNKKDMKYWIAYILTSALMIYTHYFGFLILLFEYVYLLVFWKVYKISLKKVIFSGISIFMLYSPWLPVLIKQLSYSNQLSLWFGRKILSSIVIIFIQFNSWFTPDIKTRFALRSVYHSIKEYSTSSLFGVSLIGLATIASILAITVIFSWYFLMSIRNIKNKNYIFLLMWLIIPTLIPLLITIMFPSEMPVFGYITYLLFVMPAYYLIVSIGLLKSGKAYIPLMLIIAFSLLPLYSYYSNIDKQQWVETSKYLKENRLVNELVVVSASSHVLSLGYYYNDMENIFGVKNLDELKNHITKNNSLWLIYSSEYLHDPKLIIKNYLDRNFILDKKAEFVGIKIFHYVKVEGE